MYSNGVNVLPCSSRKASFKRFLRVVYVHRKSSYRTTCTSVAVSRVSGCLSACSTSPWTQQHKRQLMSSLSSTTEKVSQSPFGHIVPDYPELQNTIKYKSLRDRNMSHQWNTGRMIRSEVSKSLIR